MKLNIYRILKRTKVEGPGERFCIWVQGCSKHCPGCWAKETWDKSPKSLTDIEDLYRMICEEKRSSNIEGVTFLGGEPFEQAHALCELAKKIKETGLSLLTFTGASLEELKAKKDIHTDRLLKYTDLLIDGGFEEDNFDLNRPWVGSTNQRYIFLSDRYSMKDVLSAKNKIEVRIDKNGFLFINGMGDFSKIKRDLCLQTPKNKI